MASSERIAVGELTSGQRVDQVFLISAPQLRTTSRGDYYIAAYLGDKTGKVNGRMWQASEAIYRSLPEEGFVSVKGRTENYQSSLQIVIEALEPVAMSEVALEEFMPATEKNTDQMFARIGKILAQIKNPHLKGLMEVFLADEELMRLLRTAPAAVALHHAYLGGLLEHTLAVMELGLGVVDLYPELERDLVLAGLFLHDIGKTSELDHQISFKYSDQGQLLGHLVTGALLVQKKIEVLNQKATKPFPAVLRDSLEHIIISHHGVREFGCPVLPATPEAFAVHYLDNLDSKVTLCFSEVKKGSGSANWTNYIRALESPLFKVRPISGSSSEPGRGQ